MKKLLALILTLTLVVSLAACGGSPATTEEPESETKVESTVDTEGTEDTKENESAVSEPTKAPEATKVPTETKAPEATKTPEATKQPTPVPSEKPAPTETPAAKTLGKTLLADFKAKAASGMSAQAIAEALLMNEAIQFNGGAMPVEEGLLSGFDNAEIKGFKEGVMFAPMIGSIAFVGYVFELENAQDAPAFISTLEKNANKRWNICVEAEEMVTGQSGNKVFFVMCPTSLEG